MSARGREFFSQYVDQTANDPCLKGLGIAFHVFNLTSEAVEEGIGPSEIIEEVGPLVQALVAAKIE